MRFRLSKLELALTILGSGLAASGGIWLDRSWGTWWAMPGALLLALSALVSHVTVQKNLLGQRERAKRRAIRMLFETCARAFGHPARHVRVNVMSMEVAGGRKRVDKSTAFNMEGDPDCDLELDTTAGASGEAARQRRSVVADLTVILRPGGPSWGLRPEEQARVRSTLKSILSVPVFDPLDPEGELLGTMQIDSDSTLEEIGFDLVETREVAQRFADLLSLLLKAEG